MATQVSPKSFSSNEERLRKLYGNLPNRAQLLNKKLQDRKYFDSGDYALSQAAKSSSSSNNNNNNNNNNSNTPSHLNNSTDFSLFSNYYVGSRHPDPTNIPHNSTPRTGINGLTNSPPRRSSLIPTDIDGRV